MLNYVQDFRDNIIIPTLQDIDMYSASACNLLLGTALHESGGLVFIKQFPNGPARGPYQMEPDTLKDLKQNYLDFRPHLNKKLELFEHQSLMFNHKYATAVARLQYYRQPDALPDAADIIGLANYWKKYWNTESGAGTPEQFIEAWERYVRGTD